MDDTVYKIALAGFFHDIGKFAERADMPITKEYLDNHADLYQPFIKTQNRHTHKHAVYTANFIEKYEHLLPDQFNKAGWGLDDSFINLTAGHHKPETPLQWVVAMADRVSSGFDRQEFEHYNNEVDNKGIPFKDFKKTRLLTLFESLSVDNQWKDDKLESYAYRYPLKELSPQNIFPIKLDKVVAADNDAAIKDYSKLFIDFLAALAHLEHKKNIPLWFEHFDSLFLIYASHIPAATVGAVVPDVSLYDHSKTTSAIAASIYRYHKDNGSLDIDSIKNYDDKKILLINGDFYGIQDFVFSKGGSTGKALAKLLRGRSFTVSLLVELAADMFCREIGIPSSSIILNAAGKFTILAPNTASSREKLAAVEETINGWLIEYFYGQSSLGISSIEATCEDFVSGRFPLLWEELYSSMDRKKFHKFNIIKHGGSVAGYLDSFNNSLDQPLCPLCGKRPSNDNTYVLISQERICACGMCHDHVYIGEHLVKEDRIAITLPDADFKGEKLFEPIFGKYQLTFDVTGKLGEMARAGSLLKYWDVSIHKDGTVSKDVTAKFINGYVPKYDEHDNYDDRLLTGKQRDETKLELIEAIKKGIPKTFQHIAKKALNYTDTPDKYVGIEALGVLKADVDNLGLIISQGIRPERRTLSRFATLSRQMNNFFSIYLPYTLSISDSLKDIYTVFAGGDDLFLVGPWNGIIESAKILNEAFRKYICHNPAITLSAGICVHKPSDPVGMLAENSEDALHKSKTGEKGQITLFGETVTWIKFDELESIKTTIENWLNDQAINNAMLYRFNELVDLARQEHEIRTSNYSFLLEDMECLKWRSKLKYSLVRNVGKHMKTGEKERVVEDLLKTVAWFETYGGGMKIPLWQILYNKRRS